MSTPRHAAAVRSRRSVLSGLAGALTLGWLAVLTSDAAGRPRATGSLSPDATAGPRPATGGTTTALGAGSPARPPAPGLPPIPRPHPGVGRVVFGAPPDAAAARRLVLTVDDGTDRETVAAYVAFAIATGVRLSFSPNGAYGANWNPVAPALRELLARGQVQLINHTFSHPDMRRLSRARQRAELERNDDWLGRTFGVTARPYWRPPFGFYNPELVALAGSLGYTTTLMWDGTLGDSAVLTEEVLLRQARRWAAPGVILLGHGNHPTVTRVFPQLLELFAERGLTLATVDDVFATSRATGGPARGV